MAAGATNAPARTGKTRPGCARVAPETPAPQQVVNQIDLLPRRFLNRHLPEGRQVMTGAESAPGRIDHPFQGEMAGRSSRARCFFVTPPTASRHMLRRCRRGHQASMRPLFALLVLIAAMTDAAGKAMVLIRLDRVARTAARPGAGSRVVGLGMRLHRCPEKTTTAHKKNKAIKTNHKKKTPFVPSTGHLTRGNKIDNKVLLSAFLRQSAGQWATLAQSVEQRFRKP